MYYIHYSKKKGKYDYGISEDHTREKMLDYMIAALGIYIDILLLNIFLKNYKLKYSWSVLVSVYIIYGIIILFVNIGIYPVFFRLLLNFVLISCIVYEFYEETRILESVKLSFVFLIILGAFEILAILLTSWIADMYEIRMLIDGKQSWIFMTVISKLGSLLVFIILARIHSKKHSSNYFAQIILLLFPVVAIVYIISEMLKLEGAAIHNILPVLFLVAMMVIIYTVTNIVFVEINSELKESKLEIDVLRRKNELQYLYYKEKLETETKMRKIYHDVKNSSLILKKSNGSVENYTTTVMDTLNEFSILEDTGNEMLNIIVREKYKLMKKKLIQFQHLVIFDFIYNMEDIDICIMFGNLFDNAIEACENIENPDERQIELKINKVQDMLVIQLKNSISSNRKLLIINEEFVTSKKDKKEHGYGIASIKEVVKKYEGDITYKIEKDCVTATVLFYLPN